MRKIIAITQISIDGVMQAPGGPEEDPSNGFSKGGWSMKFGDEKLQKVISETIAGAFDMLLGRRTYDIFAGYWPNHDDNPIGKSFNQAKKYVATTQRDDLEWHNSERLGDDVVDSIRELKHSEGSEIHVWGSSNLLQTMIAADLIDEYRLWLAPVVLGKGKRLFEDAIPPRALSLVSSEPTSTGLLINTYRPVGPL